MHCMFALPSSLFVMLGDTANTNLTIRNNFDKINGEAENRTE
jgi:hypothetical protein